MRTPNHESLDGVFELPKPQQQHRIPLKNGGPMRWASETQNRPPNRQCRQQYAAVSGTKCRDTRARLQGCRDQTTGADGCNADQSSPAIRSRFNGSASALSAECVISLLICAILTQSVRCTAITCIQPLDCPESCSYDCCHPDKIHTDPGPSPRPQSGDKS